MDLYKQAEQLASRGYQTFAIYDPEVGSGAPDYFAWVKELHGCMAQGESMDDVLENIRTAKIALIHSLLDENLEVPEPEPITNGSIINIDANHMWD